MGQIKAGISALVRNWGAARECIFYFSVCACVAFSLKVNAHVKTASFGRVLSLGLSFYLNICEGRGKTTNKEAEKFDPNFMFDCGLNPCQVIPPRNLQQDHCQGNLQDLPRSLKRSFEEFSLILY